jgi:hypothetical protein
MHTNGSARVTLGASTAHPRWARVAQKSVLALATVGLVALVDYSSSALDAPAFTPPLEDRLVYVPDPRMLRIVSLGHSAAVADLLWFRTISYFGKHYRTDRLYPWLDRMCDAVTDLDPKAEHVYRFGGVILPWEANRPDDGIALLEKGLRHFPDSWYLHWLTGFSYYFFRDNLSQAAFHLGRAAALPGSHPDVARLAAVVYAHGYDLDAAESFLRQLGASTQSEDLRSVLSLRLAELKLGRDLEALSDGVAAYTARTGNPPRSLEALVSSGILPQLPAEPFGGRYVWDADRQAVITTSGHAPLKLYVSKAREEYRQGNPVHW